MEGQESARKDYCNTTSEFENKRDDNQQERNIFGQQFNYASVGLDLLLLTHGD